MKNFIKKQCMSGSKFWRLIVLVLSPKYMYHRMLTLFKDPKFYDIDSNELKSIYKEFKKEKPSGLTGIMIIKNEEEVIENCIKACIDHLDELLVVLNKPTDNTESIVRELAKQHTLIKIIHYDYKIHSGGSEGHKKSEIHDPQTLTNLRNYALSKTSFKYNIKIDGDDYFVGERLAKIKSYMLKNKSYDICLGFRGINLYAYENEIYFFGKEPFMGGFDRCLSRMSPFNYCLKNDSYEIYKYGDPYFIFGECFYHLKCIKKDKGFMNVSLSEKEILLPKSKEKYLYRLDSNKSNLDLLTREEFSKKYPNLADFPQPKHYKIKDA